MKWTMRSYDELSIMEVQTTEKRKQQMEKKTREAYDRKRKVNLH